VGQADAVLDAGHLDHQGEHVRQRQEQHRRGVLVEDLPQRRDRGARLIEQVAVGEHASFGSAGGAGGVDDGGGVVRADRAAALVDLGIGYSGALLLQPGEVTGVDLPHSLQPGKARVDVLQPVAVLRRLDHQRDRLGVLQHPLDLLGRGGVVDRHRHRTDRP
jgi:hypothetical protein